MEKNRYYYVLKKEFGMDVDVCNFTTNGPLCEDNYEGRFDGCRDIWRSNIEDLCDHGKAS